MRRFWKWLLSFLPGGDWSLEGWDTFAMHPYAIAGRYRRRERAHAAALRQLRSLERQQPTGSSGGQDGIQDQVFIVSPDGKHERVLPRKRVTT